MKIDAKWLDEQIRASTLEGDKYTQLALQCQGVIRMAEHAKARLAQPEPETEAVEAGDDNIVPLDAEM